MSGSVGHVVRAEDASAHRARATRAWRACRLVALAAVLLAGAFSSPAPFLVLVGWPGASVLDGASLLALVVLVVDLRIRGWVRPPGIVLALAGVCFVLGLLTTFWSTSPTASLLYTLSAVQGLVLLWMASCVLRGEAPRTVVGVIGAWVVAILVPCALLWARVPGFLPPASLDPESGDYVSYFARLSHPWIGRSNNVAVLFVVFVVPLAAWGVRRHARFALVFALVAFVATAMTVSRGTLLALVVGALLLVLMARPVAVSLWRWALVSLGSAGVAVVLMVLLNPASRMHLAQRGSATNVDARLVLLSEALSDIGANPWFGVGPSTTPSVHNVLLQQLIDFGVVAGVVVDVLLVGVVLWWFTRRTRRSVGWLAVACGVGIAVQLGSCLVEASYEGGFLRNLMWLSWGLVLALYESERHAAPDTSTPGVVETTAAADAGRGGSTGVA